MKTGAALRETEFRFAGAGEGCLGVGEIFWEAGAGLGAGAGLEAGAGAGTASAGSSGEADEGNLVETMGAGATEYCTAVAINDSVRVSVLVLVIVEVNLCVPEVTIEVVTVIKFLV